MGDGNTGLVPDKRIVEIVGEGYSQERLDAIEVELAHEDRSMESSEVVT